MNSIEFFQLLLEHPVGFVAALAISWLFFKRLMERTTSSWMNPVRFNMFTFSIGAGVVIFLYGTGKIGAPIFLYTIGSMLLFWGVFAAIYNNRPREINFRFTEEEKLARCLFYACFLIYILLTLLTYKLFGIPIFNDDSRLATYTGSGLGFIGRLMPIMVTYSTFYIFHRFFSSRGGVRILYLSYLLPIILFGILSGSRSSFLGLIFAFWGYKTFYLHSEPKLKDYKYLLIPFLLISVATFALQASGNLGTAVLGFAERVIACGDLYWEALPDNTWQQVVVDHPFQFTFMGLLGPMRILDASQAEIPIGYQLTSLVYPTIKGASVGPVALFPVFGLVCFGIGGGLIFSFLQGLLAASLFKLAFIRSRSLILSALFYYSFNNLMPLLGDVSAGLGACFDWLLSMVVFAVLLLAAAACFSLQKFPKIFRLTPEYR